MRVNPVSNMGIVFKSSIQKVGGKGTSTTLKSPYFAGQPQVNGCDNADCFQRLNQPETQIKEIKENKEPSKKENEEPSKKENGEKDKKD